MGLLRRPTPLSPPVEALLRSTPRLEAPEGTRTRLLAAFERGERPTLRLRPALGWTRWAGGFAAAAALAAAFVLPGRRPDVPGPLVAATGGLRIRLVDDPMLGLGHGEPVGPAEVLFAGGLEGP